MGINKFLILLLSLSLVLILGVAKSFNYHEKELESEEGLQAMYDRWRDHHKVTEKSPRRFNIFKNNVQHIHNHNKMNKAYKLEINKFASMTNEEFQNTFTSHPRSDSVGGLHASPRARLTGCAGADAGCKPADLPKRVDWREKNVLPPVREIIGCPHASAAVIAIEAINAIRTGQCLALSDQQVLDCYPETGISVSGVLKFAKESGIATLDSYGPWTGVKKECDKSKFGNVLVTIDGEEYPPVMDEYLMKAVAEQPVIIAFDASGDEFRSYEGGIYSGPCGTNPRFSMVVVGYDEDPEGKYWIAKTAWGEGFGEKGYVRFKRGGDYGPEGLCGMYKYRIEKPVKSQDTPNIEL